jgi:hypothetical protein
MVQAILSDANIEGHVRYLVALMEGEAWRGVWLPLGLRLRTFADMGLTADASDEAVWHACQHEQVVLITANRNSDGADSLEATMRKANTLDSLPILTIADPGLVLASREYADRVVEKLLEYLVEMDHYLGTGRLYIP